MVERNLVFVFLGAENGNALLKVVFGAPIGKHGLGLSIDGDLLVRIDGVHTHGRPKAHTVIVLGHGFAYASINAMHSIVLKGGEYAKIVLAPIACDALARILDILEHRAHIGEHAVTFGLSVPLIEQAHMSHVDGGNAPGAAVHRGQKLVGAAHKLAGTVETRERVDTLGDGAFTLKLGNGKAVVMKRPVDGMQAAIKLFQDGRRLVDQALVIDGNDQAGGGDGITGNLDGGRGGALQIASETVEGITVQAVGKNDELCAARAEHATFATGERKHATGVLGKHGIDGIGSIVLIELQRAANAHGDEPRLAVIAAAAVDGVDQHALGAEPRGWVDGFDKGVVDELSNIERGCVFVAIDAIGSYAAQYVIALGVAYAILHHAIVSGAVKDLVDILGVRLEVVGVYARIPVIAAVVYVLRGQAKVAHCSLRPKRAVLIEVFDKEIASLIEH